jgi:ankyrin repeat protein
MEKDTPVTVGSLINETYFDNIKDIFEGLGLKDQIRFMNTSKKVREQLYRVYDGKDKFETMMENKKQKYLDTKQNIIKEIFSLYEKDFSKVSTERLLDMFDRIEELMKKYNIEYDDLTDLSTGKTILMFCAKYGFYSGELTKYLLDEFDLDIDEQDKDGTTALMYAIFGFKQYSNHDKSIRPFYFYEYDLDAIDFFF